MKDYTKFMKWAVVYIIDRKTQEWREILEIYTSIDF